MPLSLSLVLLKDRATTIGDSHVPFSAHRPDTVALNPTPQSHGLVHLKDREPTSGLSHSSSPRSVTVARIPDAPDTNPRLPPLAGLLAINVRTMVPTYHPLATEDARQALDKLIKLP